MFVIPSESKLTEYSPSICVKCKVAMLVSDSSFCNDSSVFTWHLFLTQFFFFSGFLCRVQFAQSDVQREGLDQTVLRSVSVTTGVNVTLKLDSASVQKVSPVTGVYASVSCGCPAALFSFFLYCK